MNDPETDPIWPSTDRIGSLVSERYDLGAVTDARLLRAWTNAVFEIRTTGGHAVLKCYRPGWRTREEIDWEIGLLDHLERSGVPVAPAIRTRDGTAIVETGPARTVPLAVLFRFAAGTKPEPPFPPELYEREGRAVAALHTALDAFRSPHRRSPLDLAALIDRPLAHIMPLVADDTRRLELLAVTDRLRERIGRLATQGLDWGPIHGDLTFDNLHLTDTAAFVWYDFDSGGPGWRALDIQGWSAFDPAWRPLGEAFVAGYRAVRPLDGADREAAPFLTLAQDVWSLSLELRYRIDRTDAAAVETFLATGIADLVAHLDHIG